VTGADAAKLYQAIRLLVRHRPPTAKAHPHEHPRSRRLPHPESFCAAMGISRPTLQRRIAEGSLPVLRVGTAVLIAKSTVAGRRKPGRKPVLRGARR
jgi:excisionase family DNA binding protein